MNNDDKPGLIARLQRFYRDKPIAFALVLIAVSTLMIIVGIWLLPSAPPA